MSRTVLVFGSTSTQGGSLVKALASRNDPSATYKILAVTRDPSSAAAQALTKLPGVKCVKYDTSNPETLFKEAGELYGVFSVQTFHEQEVKEGNAIADLAVKYRARHLVYSGIDFAGQNPTPISIFETKREIENHIKDASIHWTIIRPARFMEDFTRPELCDVAITEIDPLTKIKLVSGRDIGRVALQAIERSEEFDKEIIELAGDSKTVQESLDVWNKLTGGGQRMKKAGDMDGLLLEVVKFNAEHEFLADPIKCRAKFPFMQTFEEFVKEVK